MDKNKSVGWLVLLGGGLLILQISGAFGKLLQAFNLADSPEEQETNERLSTNAEAAALAGSPWSPSFYKSAPSGSWLPPRSTAEAMARQIYDSVGTFYDEPEEALAAIKQMKTQSGVSFLSDVFSQLYNADLYTFLEYHFDTAVQKYVLIRIGDYVSSLPKYRI